MKWIILIILFLFSVILIEIFKPINDMGQYIQIFKNGEYYSVISGPDNIHIEDSYKIKSKSDMEYVLESIKFQSNSNSLIHNINIKDAIDEWRAHNLLYNLHLFRSHTKDVDINQNKWYIKLIYKILSLLYI